MNNSVKTAKCEEPKKNKSQLLLGEFQEYGRFYKKVISKSLYMLWS